MTGSCGRAQLDWGVFPVPNSIPTCQDEARLASPEEFNTLDALHQRACVPDTWTSWTSVGQGNQGQQKGNSLQQTNIFFLENTLQYAYVSIDTLYVCTWNLQKYTVHTHVTYLYIIIPNVYLHKRTCAVPLCKPKPEDENSKKSAKSAVILTQSLVSPQTRQLVQVLPCGWHAAASIANGLQVKQRENWRSKLAWCMKMP